jgi:integrase
MNVVLREKKLKDKLSLYLDIYTGGKRTYEFLKLYIKLRPKTPEEKIQNNTIRRTAEMLRAKKELEIINNHYKLVPKGSNILFLDYFKELTKQRKTSIGNYGNWDSAYKILLQFFGGKQKKLTEITDDDLRDIRNYLLNDYRTKSNVKLSQNAASSYFNKIKACLNQAFDEKLIVDKIGVRIKSIKTEDTRREYLSQEEVDTLILTDCDSAILKNAFLFSVHTGLRWSDLNNLQWRDIYESEQNGWEIRYTQQKTQSVESLPIAKFALRFIGERQKPEDKVFKGLKYSAWNNLKLLQWMIKAGINRHITFHSARHTYATLLMSNDVNTPVISKLLGHKQLKTTEIYAKVIDRKKIDAVSIFDRNRDN